jgi:DNA-binding response OmpR family regulator
MKPKVLVVDDDRSVRESLRKLLEAQNYEVFPARDASEALEHFNAHRIGLVVLDINLGADNGWKVFEAMTIANPFVPTIVITAEWGQREKGVALGVEGLIEKPIDVPVLLNLIRDLLAETTEAKLKRICGNDAYCRYVGRHYEPYLRMLQQRYNAPFKNWDSPSGSVKADSAVPTVITDSSHIPGQTDEVAVRSQAANRKIRKEQFT